MNVKVLTRHALTKVQLHTSFPTEFYVEEMVDYMTATVEIYCLRRGMVF